MARTPKPVRKTDKNVKTLQRRSSAASTAYKKADTAMRENNDARKAGVRVSRKPVDKLLVASRKAGSVAAKTRKKTIQKAIANKTVGRVPANTLFGYGFRDSRGVKTGTKATQTKKAK